MLRRSQSLSSPLRTVFITAIAAAVGFALPRVGSGESNAAEQVKRRPNIVFILADDMGYGDLGCYGQQKIRTPRIDQLAAEGVRFTDFYAGSTVCAPSRCVLMTGLHTGHCFVRGNARLDLRPEDRTVAEVLKENGYTTGLFGKWGLGSAGNSGIPTRQGFDDFFGYLDQHHAHNYYPAFLWRNETRADLKNVVPGEGPFGSGVASTKVEYSPDLIANEALAFIDRNKDRQFFLYFASTLPHANNEAGKRGMETPDYGEYESREWPDAQKGHAAMISRLDSDVGRILDRLERHGLRNDTVVFFSSDNGPHREGGADPDFFDSNGPLRGTKRDLTDGGIRVPFIVRWPPVIRAGKVSDEVGYFADFLPTAVEIAHGRKLDGLDGRPLTAVFSRPRSEAKDRPLYWEFYERGSARAARYGRWKGIATPMESDQIEIYDVADDPGESTDLAPTRPDLVKQFRDILRQSHTDSPHWKVRGNDSKSRRTKQQ
ncbi:MAG: arylsulfatase [Planctomycetaceae bacterium]